MRAADAIAAFRLSPSGSVPPTAVLPRAVTRSVSAVTRGIGAVTRVGESVGGESTWRASPLRFTFELVSRLLLSGIAFELVFEDVASVHGRRE